MLQSASLSAEAAGPETGRRSQLLNAITDYVLEHGLLDLSLRPLAAELGTSARMLIYYFGSKERLILEALESARTRRQQDLTEASPSQDELLRWYWEWTTKPTNEAYVKLVYQVYGLALHDPAYRDFLTRDSLDWIRFSVAGLRRAGVPEGSLAELSTYIVANIRGLELDLLATRDLPRLQAAFETFADEFAKRVYRYRHSEESGP